MPNNTPDSKRLNRTFSLRLSEEEYERLRSASREQGARSVAELAREAMARMVGEMGAPIARNPGTISLRLTELDRRLRDLSHTVSQLVSLNKKTEDA